MPGISAVSYRSAQLACRQPSAIPASHRWRHRHQACRGEVIEKEKRLGALHNQIIAHGDEVDADRIVNAALNGDFQFCADTVIGRDQYGVYTQRVKQAAKAAQIAIAPVRAVDLASGAMRSTSVLPASISTPASA